MFDLAIVGAGVIGMSIARHLKDSGMRIALIDRDIEGQHASYKAGGMLGAQNEFKEDSPLFRLALKSRAKFGELSKALLEETGIDIQYQQNGLIKIATEEEDVASLQQQYEFLHMHDKDVEYLSEHDLGELTHYLVKGAQSMMFVPHDHQINANHYTKALHAALQAEDAVERFNHTNVEEITRYGDHYRIAVEAEGKSSVLQAEKVVVAAGAWAGFLTDKPEIRETVSATSIVEMLFPHIPTKIIR